uniref:MFS domain-containing protein n=1 Tax=Macrostomum lignano TaxID=282301 RepID=A0A1I8FT70_9PLAT
MERVFQQNSHFGRFQLKVTAVAVLISLLAAFHILAPIYVLYDPPQFRCRLPEDSGWHANDSLLAQSSEHNASILQFQPELDANDTNLRQHRCFIRVNDSLQACSDWVFDTEEFDSTLVTELGLVCDNSHWATVISTCSFAGILVGIVLSGLLADWLGRRVTLIVTMWLLTGAQLAGLFAVSVASPYTAPSASSSAWARCHHPPSFGGVQGAHHVTAAFGYGWSVGTAIVALGSGGLPDPPCQATLHCCSSSPKSATEPLLPRLARSWRNYSHCSLVADRRAAAAVCPALHARARLALACCRAAETRRWPHRPRQMLLDNGEPASRPAPPSRSCSAAAALRRTTANSGRRTVGTRCGGRWGCWARSPRLLLRFLVAAIYYGISMGAKNLPGSIFVTSCLIGIVDLPSYLIMHLAADAPGRKTTFIGAIGGSGLALISPGWSSRVVSVGDKMLLTPPPSPSSTTLDRGAVRHQHAQLRPVHQLHVRRFGTLFAPPASAIFATSSRASSSARSSPTRGSFARQSFLAAAISFAVPETGASPSRRPRSVEDLINTKQPLKLRQAGRAGADLLAKEEKT